MKILDLGTNSIGIILQPINTKIWTSSKTLFLSAMKTSHQGNMPPLIVWLTTKNQTPKKDYHPSEQFSFVLQWR